MVGSVPLPSKDLNIMRKRTLVLTDTQVIESDGRNYPM